MGNNILMIDAFVAIAYILLGSASVFVTYMRFLEHTL